MKPATMATDDEDRRCPAVPPAAGDGVLRIDARGTSPVRTLR